MSEQHISGFICMNHGTIQNCNSFVRFDRKLGQSVFCQNNQGTIQDSVCIYSGNSKHKTMLFANNQEKLHNCQLISYNEYKLKKSGTHLNKITPVNQDLKEGVIGISSAKELYQLSDKINHGDTEAACGSYQLTCDIDLKNKAWTPIGLNELTPFQGSFNGNGYSIKHFVVSKKKMDHAGLFGYIKEAQISNLSVDCIIKTGLYSGSIASVSDHSTIHNCTANAHIFRGKYIGGLVAKNDGTIDHCQFQGTLKGFHTLYALWAITVSFILTVGTLYAKYYVYPMLSNNGKASSTPTTVGSYYPPIDIDENSKKIKNDHLESDTKSNSVSFSLQSTLTAETGNSKASVSFENPGSSNQGIRLELQITDEELIKMIGKTGRTLVDQQALESNSNYSTKTSRVIIAESGNILPGYKLGNLQLQPLPDGTILPAGTYDAVIYMNYYNITTNEMSMVKTQSPVVLVINS